jgi:hypothetical protein
VPFDEVVRLVRDELSPHFPPQPLDDPGPRARYADTEIEEDPRGRATLRGRGTSWPAFGARDGAGAGKEPPRPGQLVATCRGGGLTWDGGYGQLGPSLSFDGPTAVRELTVLDGTPPRPGSTWSTSTPSPTPPTPLGSGSRTRP